MGGGKVQGSIDEGLQKAKTFKIAFRMEMSGFACLERSVPVICDLGVAWPIIAHRACEQVGISLDFLSYPQESEQGKRMRPWIVENVDVLDRDRMMKSIARNAGRGAAARGGIR